MLSSDQGTFEIVLKIEETASADNANKPRNPVLDFLYYDARRIGSFLSQFDPAGHLTSRKQTESASETENRRVSFTAEGNALLMKGSGLKDDQAGSALIDAEELQFDPFWSNAVKFLQFLVDARLISNDIDEAGIGDFAVTHCSFEIQDLNLLSRLTQRPAMRKILLGKHKGPGVNEREAELDILGEMNLGCEAVGHRKAAPDIWCTLKSECLSVGVSDLILKHGHHIAGEWIVVGILDAKASNGEPPRKFTHQEGFELGQQGIRGMLKVIYASMRAEVGRPHSSHGITPLMIYRRVGGRTERTHP